jgi:hypothetical protein
VPRWIRRVLVRGLASDPEARYPSMAALLDALARDPAARKRKIALAAGAAVVAATAGVLLWPAQRDTGCDADAAFANTWSDAHRGVARAAFAKSGKTYADNAFATTAANLDRFAAAWKTERDKACRDTRERHEQTEEVLLLRMACLERERAELASFVGVLEAPDDKVVELAVQASGTLSRPVECDDAHQLVATAKLPADPKVRAEIDSLRKALATSSALPVVGKPADAIKQYVPIAARAKEIGYRPLEAEASYALGLAYQVKRDYREAVDAYRAAVLAAEAGNVDRLALRACTRIAASIAAIKVAEADEWLARGAAILERLGGNDRLLEAEYEYARGVVAGEAGRDDDGVVHLRKALAARLELLGPDHPDTLLARVNLAAYADELALAKEAIEQDTAAIAGFERTLGADHPRLTIVVANLGLIQLRVGNVAEADRLFARAEALSKPYGPKNRRAAIVALLQCRVRLEQGRADEALARANDAAAAFAASGGDKSDAYGETLICRGSALLAQGKARDGIEALEQGIALREATNRERVAIAGDHTLLAEAELANGKPEDALARAERALELSAKGTRYPGELARTRFALARALVATGGDRTRASDLAKQASDELAPLPYRAALAAQVADWSKRTRL